MSHSATGWVKLAKNSNTKFVACFTLPETKHVVSFAGKLEQPIETCECAQATLTYGDPKDLEGIHEVDHADFGSYLSFALDNSVRINGQLDNRVTSVHTRAKGSWIANDA
ncbi:hypothetical protein CERSUDRAFT_112831 [Gelatoporia subvermispora B]|uniref:Uncharacterized protein n=1 Tax=Ceriporiopsis subvermispora (strain B) TaxID=914234 RepID=M2PRD1_CERS8|nr:hypothetical protein CERSUDRAFT_112831 [Gelatoporia subvermispora B]